MTLIYLVPTFVQFSVLRHLYQHAVHNGVGGVVNQQHFLAVHFISGNAAMARSPATGNRQHTAVYGEHGAKVSQVRVIGLNIFFSF